MDNLRLILILVGLVILGLIWFFHRPEGTRKPGASRRDKRRVEPRLKTDSVAGFEAELADPVGRAESGQDDAQREPEQVVQPEMNVTLPDRRPAASAQSQDHRKDGVPPEREWRDPEHRPDQRQDHWAEESPSERSSPSPRASLQTSDARSSDALEGKAKGSRPLSGSSQAGSAGPSSDRLKDKDAPTIVTLYVRASSDRKISGLSLLDAAIKAGLRFGEMKIFHRRHQGATRPVFSMANITRPGSFDPSGWNLFETQGVALFMTLPGPVSALDSWDAMLATGRRLSELLECELLDDAQCLLTRQRIGQIREQMREYDRKSGLISRPG
ncbi:MAG: cell division protein ZipA [Xanthomonadaceae bacterium]|nr:cell division protein ZipA [Xanthomonadaceae bacterium]